MTKIRTALAAALVALLAASTRTGGLIVTPAHAECNQCHGLGELVGKCGVAICARDTTRGQSNEVRWLRAAAEANGADAP